MSAEYRFFVHCPRGFINERTLMASNDDVVTRYLHDRYDDGKELTFEEVDEAEAKRRYYRRSIDVDTYYALDLAEKYFTGGNFKWDDLKKIMAENSRRSSEY